jgi:ribonuclease R
MLDKVGEEYDGIISSVTGFGLFVELKEIYVEGLVHITSLPNDYYHFDAIGHRLRGDRAGRVFRLGNPVRVRVMRVNLDDRKIDFDLVSAAEPSVARDADRAPKGRPGRGRSDGAAKTSSARSTSGGKPSKAGNGGKSKQKGPKQGGNKKRRRR